MISTSLFTERFKVLRNYPANVSGILQDNYEDAEIEILGRISNPSNRERLLYQSRSLFLSAVIYSQPYDFDKENDVLEAEDGTQYKIQDLETPRDSAGQIAFLKIPVTEKLKEINPNES